MEDCKIKDAILEYLSANQQRVATAVHLRREVDLLKGLGLSHDEIRYHCEIMVEDDYLKVPSSSPGNLFQITVPGIKFIKDGGGYCEQESRATHREVVEPKYQINQVIKEVDDKKKEGSEKKRDRRWQRFGIIAVIVLGVLTILVMLWLDRK